MISKTKKYFGRHCYLYIKIKTIMTICRLVEHSISFRAKAIESLYSRVKSLINFHVDYLTKKFDKDHIKNEVMLRFEYGGEQFHLKSNDPLVECVCFRYIDMNRNSNSQSAFELNHSIEINRDSLKTFSQTLAKPKPLIPICDENFRTLLYYPLIISVCVH